MKTSLRETDVGLVFELMVQPGHFNTKVRELSGRFVGWLVWSLAGWLAGQLVS